jgi:hypothetical protein
MKTLFSIIFLLLILTIGEATALAAPSIDRLLRDQITAAPLESKPVVITFDRKPTNADFLFLKSLGITGGQVLRELPIILTKINANQFNVLKTKSGFARFTPIIFSGHSTVKAINLSASANWKPTAK